MLTYRHRCQRKSRGRRQLTIKNMSTQYSLVYGNITAPLHRLPIDFPDLEHDLELPRLPDPVKVFLSLLTARLHLRILVRP